MARSLYEPEKEAGPVGQCSLGGSAPTAYLILLVESQPRSAGENDRCFTSGVDCEVGPRSMFSLACRNGTRGTVFRTNTHSYPANMKASTSYLIGAIAFLQVSAYMILSAEWAWHSVLAIALTFIAGVMYTIYGISEKRKERVAARASVSD